MKKKNLNSILAVVVILILVSLLIRFAIYVPMRGWWLFFKGIPSLLEVIFVLCSCYWAVICSNKFTGILGTISLVLSQLFSLFEPFMVASISFDWLVISISICASIVLLIAMAVGKNKASRLIPLAVLGVVFLSQFMKGLFINSAFRLFFAGTLLIFTARLCDLFFYGLLPIYFFLLGVYVMIGGKPFKKKSTVKTVIFERNDTPSYNGNSYLLVEQLTQLKNEFEAGKISEEEYKQQRIELLRRTK